MTTVLLIIHLLVTSALVGVVLMQRSEGGALGIGGGGPGGMMSGRGAASLLTRLTMVLGALFIANSILLAFVQGAGTQGDSVFDRVGQEQEQSGDIDMPFSFDDAPGDDTAGPEAAQAPESGEAETEDAPSVPPGR